MKYGVINKQLRADRITLFVKLWFELTDEDGASQMLGSRAGDDISSGV